MLKPNYKLICEDSVLLAQPILIQHYGRVGALLIQQIHYWSQKGHGFVHDNKHWIYNTAEQWAEQLCVSARTIKRTVRKLLEDGVIFVKKLSKHKSNQTNSYSINQERLNEISATPKKEELEQNNQNHSSQANSQPYNVLTGSNPHGDILSPSSRQIDPMVIQETTNKNLNKSEGSNNSLSSRSQAANQQVEQVKKLINEENIQLGKSSTSNTTVQDMLKIWNTSFEKSESKLSKELAKSLMGAFKHKFNNSLEEWQMYCRLIASSDYLTGSKFTLNLEWALKFSTIDRLRTGDLGVKAEDIVPLEATLETKAIAHISGSPEPDICKKTRHLLLEAYGAKTYLSWFTCVDIIYAEEGEGAVHLKPHNLFIESELQRRFPDIFEKING